MDGNHLDEEQPSNTSRITTATKIIKSPPVYIEYVNNYSAMITSFLTVLQNEGL